MLVDVAGDGEVASSAVPLDVQSVDCSAGSGFCCGCAPDVQSVTGWADFDVAAWMRRHEFGCCRCGLPVNQAVVEVDPADSVAQDESEPDAGA